MSRRDGLRRALGAALVVMLALIFMGGFSYGRARLQLMNAAKEKYGALRDVRSTALEEYLAGLAKETRYWARNTVLQGALVTFRTAWDDLGDDPQAELQRLFIEENPHPVGEKDSLEFVRDGSDYADAHASYHDWFRRFLTHRGFYDVFLIDPEGNLVYTVFKEMDYATNLETGRYKDTGLARVFREAR
ncbi:MAG: methyl-accepting chemotaxis protein, partial [Deltaproteobacteria bacterium]|nr:methyl-accepting chemotaxis protein [Deltaproteobacteria bacterium]